MIYHDSHNLVELLHETSAAIGAQVYSKFEYLHISSHSFADIAARHHCEDVEAVELALSSPCVGKLLAIAELLPLTRTGI